MGKIINYKNMSVKQKILFMIILVAILITLTWLLRVINNKREIQENAIVSNYNEIENASYFRFQGVQTYDRQIYWDLNDIIASYIQSFLYEADDLEFSSNNYFNALTTEYRDFLGENKYNEISQNFIKKFEIQGIQELNYKTQDFISNIYDIQNDMYFCELKGVNEQKAYIGIKLNTENKTFQIFYIE